MSKMKYTIYNHAEQTLVYDRTTGTPEKGYHDMKFLEFDTEEEAEAWKDADLDSGNYYDRPHTVYEITASEKSANDNMKNFVTVIQVSASQFEVFKFNAETETTVNTGDDYKGVLVACLETNTENKMHCFELAEKMNNELAAKTTQH